MATQAESIIERRRLRNRLALWRTVAIIAVLAVILLLVPRPSDFGFGRKEARGDHVARVDINGVIASDRKRLEAIRRVRDADRAKALVVRISSPGGTVVGSEALFEALREVAEKKPVVAVLGEIAASGGYAAAIGADHIIARRNTITGSIGVISQIPNVTGLLDSIGVDILEVKSAPLKAAPNPTTPTSPEAIAALEALILDSFEWFQGIVGERRGLDGTALTTVTDGRVFTGHQGMALGLVDEIGDEETARAWLETTHEIAESLPVRDYKAKRDRLPFGLDRFMDRVEGHLPAPVQLGPGPRLLALYTG